MQGVGVVRNIHFFPTIDDKAARSNANDGPVAAIITRVWNADVGIINLTAFPDGGQPIVYSSVPHKSAVEDKPAFHKQEIAYWDWPARV